MKVTLQYLKNQNACQDGIDKFNQIFGKSAELKDVINYCIKTKDKLNLQYCNWVIVRKMTRKQKIQYATFAAKPVQKNRDVAVVAYDIIDAAAYAYAANKKTLSKILKYGLKLIYGDEK